MPAPTHRFTGCHMTIILVTFFAVVIGVNLIMARFAIGTFGGTVVENSYVASQKFNGWLEQGRQQRALGWTISLALDPARHIAVSLSDQHAPLQNARVSAVARHPLGRAPSVALAFETVAPGELRAVEPLPAGRWQIQLLVERGSDQLRRIETVQ